MAMSAALYLLLAQGLLGAFDTLWYHEYRLRLPRKATAKTELRLHAARDFAYTVVFGTLGWIAWQGAWAALFAAILLAEIVITLWDFVEEDRTRRLPAGERVMHGVMGIVYGAFLATFVPHLLRWTALPTALATERHEPLSWALTAFACGVCASGVRDLVASFWLPPALTGE
jgi:hypothetical protein